MTIPRSLISFLVATAVTLAQSKNPDAALGAARHMEEAEGNYPAAIAAYKKIIAQAGKDRPLAAKALVRMGQCYEKLGDAEARKTYERVLKEYADQPESATAARALLAALAQPARPTGLTVRRVSWQIPNAPHVPSSDGRYMLTMGSEQKDGTWARTIDLYDLISHQSRRVKAAPLGREDFFGYGYFSPDSRQIAYIAYHYPPGTKTLQAPMTDVLLRVMNSDGSDDRVVVRRAALASAAFSAPGSTGAVGLAGWFPDGKRVLMRVRQSATATRERLLIVSVADGAAKVVKELEDSNGNVRLSPDGRFVAYRVVVKRDPPTVDIRLFSIEDSTDTVLIHHPSQNIHFLWAPDSRGMVFASNRRGNFDTWYIAMTNGVAQGEAELIKSDLKLDGSLDAITRDGTLYYTETVGTQDTLVAEFDPATGKAVTQPAAIPRQTAGEPTSAMFSPDGQSIAYFAINPRGTIFYNLVLRSLTGKTEQIVATRFTDLRNLSNWFPDSRSILVNANDRDRGWGFYRVDVATGASTLLKAGEFGDSTRTISKDGKTIYYGRKPTGDQRIHVLAWDLESGKERELTTVEGYLHPRLSPDGRELALEDVGTRSLSIMPAAGGDRREIYRVPAPEFLNQLQWSPDGRYLIFFQGTGQPASGPKPVELRRIAVAGGQPETILRLPDNAGSGLGLHPDGRRVVFSRPGAQHEELWALENFIPGLKAPK